MRTISLLMVLAAGAGLAFQAPINARLRDYAGSPLASALISFATGTVVLAALLLGTSSALSLERLRTGPWWIFIGGSLGVLYVFSAIVAVPRIGAALLLAAAVAGQLIGAMCIDHFGWFGIEPSPFNAKRATGAVLLAAALWCLRK